MASTPISTPSSAPARPRISSELWAVALSLALALLIRAGVIRSVPW